MARGPKARTAKNSRTAGGKAASTGPWDGFSPPPDFDPVALAEFARLKAALAQAGVLDRTDPRVACMAAAYHGQITRAEAELGTGQYTLETANGTLMPHPMLKVIASFREKLRGLLNDMGLTPKTAKISGAQPETESRNAWDGILNVAG